MEIPDKKVPLGSLAIRRPNREEGLALDRARQEASRRRLAAKWRLILRTMSLLDDYAGEYALTMELRIFVVEPDPMRQRMLATALEKANGVVVAGNARAPAEEEIVGARPDLILVSSALIHGAGAQEVLVRASRRLPEAQFVLVGSSADLEALLRASISLPLRGFLSLNHLSEVEFERALLVIASGGAVIEPLSARQLLSYLRHASAPGRRIIDASRRLSERELEIMKLVSEGLSNKEIAFRLGIGQGTVRTHLRNIFRKLGVASRTGAARLTFPPAASGRAQSA
jgi:DNA-binding NarL/FixJ family response regulator